MNYWYFGIVIVILQLQSKYVWWVFKFAILKVKYLAL